MRHELTNDADEISMPRLPGISLVNLRRFYACAICFMALVLIVLLCNWAINLYTDYLWFNKLGRSDVFTKILLFKVILFTSCFIISGACLIWNIRWAFNNARGAILLRLHDDVRRLLITIIGSIVALGVVVSVAVLLIASSSPVDAVLNSPEEPLPDESAVSFEVVEHATTKPKRKIHFLLNAL